MLWHKAQGAGGLVGGGGITLSANYTDSLPGQTSITLPSSGIVGDIAIISHTALYSQMIDAPAGWTRVSLTENTGSFRQGQGVMYKIIESSDLGATLTINGSTLASSYAQIQVTTFSPSAPINTVTVSSLDVDFSTSNGSSLPTRTKDTSVYDPPNIVFAACSNYNSAFTSAFSDESFFDSVSIDNNTLVSLAAAYEIQEDFNASRTLDPVFGGTSAICHSFVLNAS